eukprot:TRINITY_DN14057_c0_g1_i1.p1 TRINITY_DN14057_c0_g1~~TRINITY_DN14057_c0_g1_i1.p1  ORF type:complete len:396 (+),score=79.15 TRINITY_DN14057_c0_g1_i1:35-1189(+)
MEPEDGYEDNTNEIVVQGPDQPKPFIGGFRHRKTGVEYHHAVTQTPAPSPKEPKVIKEKAHRDTQTAKIASRTTQGRREAGAQTKRPGLDIEERTDVPLHARPYFDSASYMKLIEQKALIIQCFARGWFARTVARQMRADLDTKRQEHAERDQLKREAFESKKLTEIERRMHPRSREDFDVLYNELEAWRLQETKRINAMDRPEQERMSLLAQLLYKETKLLQTIDKLKLSAGQENKDERVQRQLELMAAPKKWEMSDGVVADVHTPYTTRSRELLELYTGLKMTNLSLDNRLDVLLHVKYTVKQFDCNLTREIVDLIDREADMLNRGRPDKSLAGLRHRTANLFLQFVETPEFNAEAARFQRVPRELLQRQDLQPIPPRGIKA